MGMYGLTTILILVGVLSLLTLIVSVTLLMIHAKNGEIMADLYEDLEELTNNLEEIVDKSKSNGKEE